MIPVLALRTSKHSPGFTTRATRTCIIRAVDLALFHLLATIKDESDPVLAQTVWILGFLMDGPGVSTPYNVYNESAAKRPEVTPEEGKVNADALRILNAYYCRLEIRLASGDR
ncbi:uncharacterized protein CDV56_101699 [Aspergillus thermomutatus]|uniref:Uncharacterized protein n=1 Tax=Aspergillus thermomutatus TaxID=41047 RepID=A0A397H3H6_ASPTH|nr:uncharacterized protein CDV56_101699 [Aspergillus thermomutatus]RHZ56254.1 hypothetical protein CDV56_101699 [Aspergillus thermomutatus]